MRRFLFIVTLLIGGCSPATPIVATVDTATRAIALGDSSGMPAMRSFPTARAAKPKISNNDLALDFMELAFHLESGRALPRFTRFEGPITVRVTGAPPPSMGPDLTKLLYRLRNEAGIDISYTTSSDANITVEAVTRAQIRNAIPSAACFVVPNISSIGEYRSAKRAARTNWSGLQTRQRVAIFLPNDAPPQEMRDCLHEELAQALGPLNDLYRLSNSVFNDDNVHTVLTGFDMMILRAYYDPSLRSGMNREEVSSKLPGILSKVNPAGSSMPSRFSNRTPRDWTKAVQTALGPGASTPQRQAAVQTALTIAASQGWEDHRRGFAHYAAGRIAQINNPRKAIGHFQQADSFFARVPGTALHRAYVGSQLAAHAIANGEGARALSIAQSHIATARRSENAALLSTLLLLQAEALDMTGQVERARAVRLDSLGWARYGFGADWAVRAKVREIAALNPLKRG